MVQALPQYSQVQVAPSPQVVVPQGNPQWQSQPQLVNPYLSTGQTPQYSHPQQYLPTQGGWVQTTPQMAVASHQPNHQAEYLALNSVAPNYSQNLPSPQPQYSQASPQYNPKIDPYAPSGKDSQGNPLSSVVELINAWGKGDTAVAIARLHQALIHREDQLGEVVAYTQALEKEVTEVLAPILATPEATGKWLQYQEFYLAQLPEVINFRNAYPQATFEQYYDYLVQSNRPQAQPQQERPPAPLGYEYAPEPQAPTFNQMNMGVGQGTGGQVATRKTDLLRQMDLGHFGQFFSQLA